MHPQSRSDRALLTSTISRIEYGEVHRAMPQHLVEALRLACRIETAHSGMMRSVNHVAHRYSATYLNLLHGKTGLQAENLPPMLELVMAGRILQSRLTIENDRYLDDRRFRAMLMTVHLGLWETAETVIQDLQNRFDARGAGFSYVASYETGKRQGDGHLHLLGLFAFSNDTPRMRPLYQDVRDYLADRNGDRPGHAGHTMQRGRSTPAQLKPVEVSFPVHPRYGVSGLARTNAYISKEQPGFLSWDRQEPDRQVFISRDLLEEFRVMLREYEGVRLVIEYVGDDTSRAGSQAADSEPAMPAKPTVLPLATSSAEGTPVSRDADPTPVYLSALVTRPIKPPAGASRAFPSAPKS